MDWLGGDVGSVSSVGLSERIFLFLLFRCSVAGTIDSIFWCLEIFEFPVNRRGRAPNRHIGTA
jgi:hypothetical protein